DTRIFSPLLYQLSYPAADGDDVRIWKNPKQSQTAGLSLWRNLFRRQAGPASGAPELSRKQSDAAAPLPHSTNANTSPWRFPWLRIAGDAASSIVYRAKQTVSHAIARPTPKAQSLTRQSRGGTSIRRKKRRQWRSHTVRRQVR